MHRHTEHPEFLSVYLYAELGRVLYQLFTSRYQIFRCMGAILNGDKKKHVWNNNFWMELP